MYNIIIITIQARVGRRLSVPFLLHHGVALIIVAAKELPTPGDNVGRRYWCVPVIEPINQMRKVLDKKL